MTCAKRGHHRYATGRTWLHGSHPYIKGLLTRLRLDTPRGTCVDCGYDRMAQR